MEQFNPVPGPAQDDFNSLADKVANLIAVESYTTDEATIADNSRGVFTKSISKSGYTPLGIIDITLSNNYLCLGSYTISGSTASLVFHNEHGSSITASATFKVIYKKN